MLRVDADGRILRASEHAGDILGAPSAALLGCALLDLLHLEDEPALRAEMLRVLGGDARRGATEVRLRSAEESARWARITLAARRVPGGITRELLCTLEDVTERRREEDALRRREAHLNDAQRIAQIGSWAVDQSTMRLAWSEQQYRIWEMAPTAPLSIEATQARVHREDLALMQGAFARALHEGGELDVVARLVMPDGRVKHVHTRGGRSRQGEPDTLVGTTLDVTRAVEAEQRLAARERMLSAIFDATFDLMILVERAPDGTWIVVAANRAYFDVAKHYGMELTRERVLGRELADVLREVWNLSPDASAAMIARYDEALRTRAPVAFETHVETPAGRGYAENVIAPVIEEDGTARRALWTGRDVTSRKTTERALGESERQLRDLAENMREVFWIVDPVSFDLVYLSPSHEQLLGTKVERLPTSATAWIEHVHPDDRHLLFEGRVHVRDSGPTEVEYRMIKRDGAVCHVRTRGAPVRDERGEVVRIVGITFDVTAERHADDERRRAVEDLQRLNAELERRVAERTAAVERAGRAKDEFLAGMSHELRTPLNAVLGLSEALRDGVYGPLEDRQRRALDRIEDSGAHLLSLISDILDLSKIEAGGAALDLHEIGVDDVCRASIAMVQGLAHKKQQRVAVEIEDGFVTLRADERRLKQILVNLLSNAVKFTPERGSLGLRVTLASDARTIVFTVWDTGIGIAEADQARLFQPFVQLDSSLSRQHAGTGLGLALVGRLVSLHGGEVTVDSAPDRGSRFTVVLPRGRITEGPRRSLSPRRGTPAVRVTDPSALQPRREEDPLGRLVLAEDDDTNVATLSEFLTSLGYEVHHARDGREAIARVNEVIPDLVLMDVQMPIVDGLAAMRAIRASTTPRIREVPIIALTALAMPGDRERCLAAGADEYLTKPVGLKRLAVAIEALRETRRA